MSNWSNSVYNTFDPTWGVPTWFGAIGKGMRAAFKHITGDDSQDYKVTDKVADAGWRKRLGKPYDRNLLIDNGDGSVRLPKNIEMEIPTDTTMLKNRILANERLAKQNNIMGDDYKLVQSMIDKDRQTLDSLRYTYKTGKPVVINEYSHNSRKLAKDGQLIDGTHDYNTPLSIMQNYTVQYDPETNSMKYRDIYDFNQFEWLVPGVPFNIQGSIKLK